MLPKDYEKIISTAEDISRSLNRIANALELSNKLSENNSSNQNQVPLDPDLPDAKNVLKHIPPHKRRH